MKTLSKSEELASRINWGSVPEIKETLALAAEIFPNEMAAKVAPKKEMMFRCLLASGWFLNFWGNNYPYGGRRHELLLEFAIDIARHWSIAWEKQKAFNIFLEYKDGKGKPCHVDSNSISTSNGATTFHLATKVDSTS